VQDRRKLEDERLEHDVIYDFSYVPYEALLALTAGSMAVQDLESESRVAVLGKTRMLDCSRSAVPHDH
jgi:hypothetical protein